MSVINKQFIQARTKAGFEARLAANEVKATSIAFIEDTKQIWANGKYYSAVPADGHDRQILTWKANGEAKWEDLSNTFTGIGEVLAYGVEWDVTVQDPHITRIGNMSLHKSLPIQSQLKGCIAQGDKIIYWLNESDWRWRKDPVTKSLTIAAGATEGEYTITDAIFSTKQYDEAWIKIGNIAAQVSVDTATSTATFSSADEIEEAAHDVELGAVLNGYDGTVRVYCPNFYIKSESEGNKRRVWLSTVKVDNTWEYQPEILIDAYRTAVMASQPGEEWGYLHTLPANSAISVVNKEGFCRGGQNNSAYDKYLETDPCRCGLGKPRTNIPRSSMRTYSRNAGNNMLSYDQYKNIFYWLYVVEYANFNCQEAFNAAATAEGYKQGGLGAGVTNWGWDPWVKYNNYNPLTPCGYTNELGNGTGIKAMTSVAGTDNLDAGTTAIAAVTSYVPRWRGFENPFGDIWTNLDGIVIDADADNHPNNMNWVYTCQDPSKYADTITADYKKVGEEIHAEGYCKTYDLGTAAHIIPNANGGDTTKFKCDYHYVGEKNKTLRMLLVGGRAGDGSAAGLGFFCSGNGVSDSAVRIGFRSVSPFMSFPSQD